MGGKEDGAPSRSIEPGTRRPEARERVTEMDSVMNFGGAFSARRPTFVLGELWTQTGTLVCRIPNRWQIREKGLTGFETATDSPQASINEGSNNSDRTRNSPHELGPHNAIVAVT